MPELFNVLVCILALLVGILIGKKYRQFKSKFMEDDTKDSKNGKDSKNNKDGGKRK